MFMFFCCLQQQEAQQQVTFLRLFIYENCQSVYYLTKTQYNRNRLAYALVEISSEYFCLTSVFSQLAGDDELPAVAAVGSHRVGLLPLSAAV